KRHPHVQVNRKRTKWERAPERDCQSDLSELTPRKKASRSALTWSFWVVHMPCDAPLYTLSVAFLMIFAESSAESAIGTIWSSAPCRIKVGTSNFLRSSVRSVSEKALIQK